MQLISNIPYLDKELNPQLRRLGFISEQVSIPTFLMTMEKRGIMISTSYNHRTEGWRFEIYDSKKKGWIVPEKQGVTYPSSVEAIEAAIKNLIQ